MRLPHMHQDHVRSIHALSLLTGAVTIFQGLRARDLKRRYFSVTYKQRNWQVGLPGRKSLQRLRLEGK